MVAFLANVLALITLKFR
ncbi:putative phospho-N-acetylmuramoyl-pentapeptide transferase (fragment) mraY [Sulfurovum sp. enrichment culture clone C5]|uniref:Putative phospho-N-acetylmuramoyl-pentapeptide transferase mraY n=1 Tax=Sulfurovum sp. enrichment culture clone C5 TaxID=497650 RepID=A0A0S4XQW0_9BACT